MEPISKPNNRLMRNPQTIAWVIVLASFALFCVLCASGTFGAYWFMFESGVPLTTRLTVSRGAVTVVRPDLTSYLVNSAGSSNYIAPSSILQTDADSQGYLTFEDSYSGQLIGTVYILENTSIGFTEAVRPRFEWGKAKYAMLLSNAIGRFSIDLSARVTRGSVLSLTSESGTAYVEDGGSYAVEALDQHIQVYTRYGKGLLYASDLAWQVNENALGRLEKGQHEVSLTTYPFDMLNLAEPGPPQPSFGADDPSATANNSLPLFWACESFAQSPNEIQGMWQRKNINNSVVLEFARRGLGPSNRPLGPAFVGCRFSFPRNPLGLHVSQYSSLVIRLKMKIVFQDVTTCGILGSECPIMLEMKYVDINGQPQFWRQGFYADRPSSDNSIQRCDTCPHDHQQINKDAWYIYDTGDLKKQFPADKMIDYVEYVRVYASGHQFEVALSDFTVLGGKGAVSVGR
jgi:hypothetical protein